MRILRRRAWHDKGEWKEVVGARLKRIFADHPNLKRDFEAGRVIIDPNDTRTEYRRGD